MKKTDYKFNKQSLSYELTDDGYDIYLGGKLWITQHVPYNKPINADKTIEENCLLQIEQICTVLENPEE